MATAEEQLDNILEFIKQELHHIRVQDAIIEILKEQIERQRQEIEALKAASKAKVPDKLSFHDLRSPRWPPDCGAGLPALIPDPFPHLDMRYPPSETTDDMIATLHSLE